MTRGLLEALQTKERLLASKTKGNRVMGGRLADLGAKRPELLEELAKEWEAEVEEAKTKAEEEREKAKESEAVGFKGQTEGAGLSRRSLGREGIRRKGSRGHHIT